MHLKLAQLITKNPNGIEIQIYSCLIAYVLLKLVEIPKEFGAKLLDKLRYLQAFMCENISIDPLNHLNSHGHSLTTRYDVVGNVLRVVLLTECSTRRGQLSRLPKP